MGFYVGGKESPLSHILISQTLYRSIVGYTYSKYTGLGKFFGGGSDVSVPTKIPANIKFDNIFASKNELSAPVIGMLSTNAYTFDVNSSSPTLLRSNVSYATANVSSFCFIDSITGNLYRTGNNKYGLNEGNLPISYSSPVLSSSITDAITMRAGKDFFVFMANGVLYTIGNNDYGQLGTGDTNPRFSPVSIMTFTNRPVISVGDDFVIAVETDTVSSKVYAWGNNTYGQLGDGTTVSKSTPVISFSLSAATTYVVSGQSHTMLYRQSTSVSLYTWGNNTYGQLGDGTTVSKSTPVLIYSDSISSDVTIIGTTQNSTHYCTFGKYAQAYNRSVKCYSFGRGDTFENGCGGISTSTPTLIFSDYFADDRRNTVGDGGQNWSIIYQTGSQAKHVLISSQPSTNTDSAFVLYWGDNTYGQLGDGTTVSKSTPVILKSITDGSPGFFMLPKAGDGSFYYRSEKNTFTTLYPILAAGSNSHGQLLNVIPVGSNASSAVQLTMPSATNIRGIANNLASVWCSITDTVFNNKTFEFGSFGYGTSRGYPISNVLFDSNSWKKVLFYSELDSPVAGLKLDGTLWVMGIQDSNNRLERYKVGKNRIGSNILFKDVQLFGAGGLAQDISGTLWGWGINTNYLFGNGLGTSAPLSVLTQVASSIKWITYSVSDTHALAIDTSGRLFVWGSNAGYQLGNGTNVGRSTPVQVGTSSNWVAVWAGGMTSIAKNNKQQYFVCGVNANGQLGIGNVSGVSSFTLTTWSGIKDIVPSSLSIYYTEF